MRSQDNPVAVLNIDDAPAAFHYLAGRFVPLDHGQFGYADFPRIDADVSTADGRGLYLHHHLAGLRLRAGNVFHDQIIGTMEYCCFHDHSFTVQE